MTVNGLIVDLQKLQREGYGDTEVVSHDDGLAEASEVIVHTNVLVWDYKAKDYRRVPTVVEIY